jgi:hypothetical protein
MMRCNIASSLGTASTGYSEHWIQQALDTASTGYSKHWIQQALMLVRFENSLAFPP